VIAVLAFIVDGISLLWNIAVHRSSGVRVRLRFTCGFLDYDIYVNWEPTKEDNPERMAGVVGVPVFAVAVRNTDRLPAVVTKAAFGEARFKVSVSPDFGGSGRICGARNTVTRPFGVRTP
jgi:hypothetical protein